jgi:hypothetical protein
MWRGLLEMKLKLGQGRAIAHAEAGAEVLAKQLDGGAIVRRILSEVADGLDHQALAFEIARIGAARARCTRAGSYRHGEDFRHQVTVIRLARGTLLYKSTDCSFPCLKTPGGGMMLRRMR